MEQNNLISIIAKLAKNETLSRNEIEINERAIKKAKTHGFNANGQFNFETRNMINLPPLKEVTNGIMTKSSDIQNILNRCVYLPNCTSALKVPFVDFNAITWGYNSGNSCAFDSAKLSAKRISTTIDLSMMLLNSTSEDFQLNFQNAVFDGIFKKVFLTAFSTQPESDTTPTGLLSITSSVTLSDVDTLINMQKQVDKIADGGVWICSPSAKAKLNEINTSTKIFDNGKMLNSDIIFTNLVDDGYLLYVDLSKFVIAEFGVMSVNVDNYTQKVNGVVRMTFEGFFDTDLAYKNCIAIGRFED